MISYSMLNFKLVVDACLFETLDAEICRSIVFEFSISTSPKSINSDDQDNNG